MIRDAKAGSEEAVAALLLRVDGLLRASVGKVVGRGDEMEDAVQEARFALARGLAGFDEARPFGPWAQVVARNAAVSYVRRHRGPRLASDSEQTLAPPVAPASLDAAVSRLDSHDALQRVDEAWARLAKKDRQVLDLRLRRELPHVEVAHILGVTQGAARVRFVRALAALRKELGERR